MPTIEEERAARAAITRLEWQLVVSELQGEIVGLRTSVSAMRQEMAQRDKDRARQIASAAQETQKRITHLVSWHLWQLLWLSAIIWILRG